MPWWGTGAWPSSQALKGLLRRGPLFPLRGSQKLRRSERTAEKPDPVLSPWTMAQRKPSATMDEMWPEDPGRRESRIASIVSLPLNELSELTTTTCSCQMAVLPLKLLVQLQPAYFVEQAPEAGSPGSITVHNFAGGYNVFCDGSVKLDGHQYRVHNYISRKVELKSHADYKNFRETILSRPMLFFLNATRIKQGLSKEKTFALIVNTRHPRMRGELEQGMNNIISSVWGENYKLKICFHKEVVAFLSKENYRIDGETLSFTYHFKADALLDIFYLTGMSKKKVECEGKVMNLFCNNPEKRAIVTKILTKMSTPLVGMLTSTDRRFSRISGSSIDVVE